MRERAQASVETVALLALALALAAALLLGVATLGPPLAASLAEALSGAFGQGTQRAPGLDPFERLLVEGATGADADGPTLLDLRSHLRAHLERPAADAAFAASLHALVVRTLAADGVEQPLHGIEVVDRSTEDGWLRRRFHPGFVDRVAQATARLAGTPGAVISLAEDFGVADAGDEIEPGYAAGDLVVHVGSSLLELILRRLPGTGLAVIGSRFPAPPRGGIR